MAKCSRCLRQRHRHLLASSSARILRPIHPADLRRIPLHLQAQDPRRGTRRQAGEPPRHRARQTPRQRPRQVSIPKPTLPAIQQFNSLSARTRRSPSGNIDHALVRNATGLVQPLIHRQVVKLARRNAPSEPLPIKLRASALPAAKPTWTRSRRSAPEPPLSSLPRRLHHPHQLIPASSL